MKTRADIRIYLRKLKARSKEVEHVDDEICGMIQALEWVLGI